MRTGGKAPYVKLANAWSWPLPKQGMGRELLEKAQRGGETNQVRPWELVDGLDSHFAAQVPPEMYCKTVLGNEWGPGEG
jgi:hypothetical protein